MRQEEGMTSPIKPISAQDQPQNKPRISPKRGRWEAGLVALEEKSSSPIQQALPYLGGRRLIYIYIGCIHKRTAAMHGIACSGDVCTHILRSDALALMLCALLLR